MAAEGSSGCRELRYWQLNVKTRATSHSPQGGQTRCRDAPHGRLIPCLLVRMSSLAVYKQQCLGTERFKGGERENRRLPFPAPLSGDSLHFSLRAERSGSSGRRTPRADRCTARSFTAFFGVGGHAASNAFRQRGLFRATRGHSAGLGPGAAAATPRPRAGSASGAEEFQALM